MGSIPEDERSSRIGVSTEIPETAEAAGLTRFASGGPSTRLRARRPRSQERHSPLFITTRHLVLPAPPDHGVR